MRLWPRVSSSRSGRRWSTSGISRVGPGQRIGYRILVTLIRCGTLYWLVSPRSWWERSTGGWAWGCDAIKASTFTGKPSRTLSRLSLRRSHLAGPGGWLRSMWSGSLICLRSSSTLLVDLCSKKGVRILSLQRGTSSSTPATFTQSRAIERGISCDLKRMPLRYISLDMQQRLHSWLPGQGVSQRSRYSGFGYTLYPAAHRFRSADAS